MKKYGFAVLFLLYFSSCVSTKNTTTKDDGKISFNLVLINDVYEIAPLAGGKEGGMARIATLKKELLQKNPNTLLIMAGDFLSPSVYNSLRFEGQPIRGRQMVEAMNLAGVDFVTFGNHELDIRENELQSRIDESAFQWISSNVFQKDGKGIHAFHQKGKPIPETLVLQLKDADGTHVRVGLIGICLPYNRAEYVYYTDPIETAKKLYHQLADSVDAVIAITHQTIHDDKRLAQTVPELTLILGGHEHDQRFEKVGNIYITKALSNAKSAFVIDVNIKKKKRKIRVDPEVRIIDETIALDSATNKVVEKWSAVASQSFTALGFEANRIVLQEGPDLDAREALMRHQQSILGRLITESMLEAAPQSRIALFNSGSIRVDDVLHMPLTEYDVIRTMPFGGGIREVEMKGKLLMQVLEQGDKNAGSGGYLIRNDNLKKNQVWMLDQEAIQENSTYRVVMSEFLLTGKETNLDFLNEQNKDIQKVYPAPAEDQTGADIRRTLIHYLRKGR